MTKDHSQTQLPVLKDHELHVWLTNDRDIVDPEQLQRYRLLLSDEETARHERFVFEKDRHQFLVTRALVREVLSLYQTEVSPRDWEFDKNQYGKPHVINNTSQNVLFFNVSHTSELIAMLVARREDVGIDVENLQRDGRFLDIADRYFADTEVEDLFRLPTELQEDRFFDLWTLKESYIKARGMGLSIPLGDFGFSFPTPNGLGISFQGSCIDRPEDWSFWQFNPTNQHRLAVAAKSLEHSKRLSVLIRKIIPGGTSCSVDVPVVRCMPAP